MMGDQSLHAFLPPSGAPVWVLCAAAPKMWQLYPEAEDNAAALEGEAVHWAGAELLAGRDIALGLVAPNNMTLDAEMVEAADDWCQLIRRWDRVEQLHIEERVTVPLVHADNWGTPDAWAFGHNPTTGRGLLRVADLKYGHGYVPVFENWQLIDYACGILSDLGVNNAIGDKLLDVEFTIFQPRNYSADGPVRTWRVKVENLRPLYERLRVAAEAATGPNPPAAVNPGCKHCSARHACGTLQQTAYANADLAYANQPIDLGLTALGQELRILRRAKAALDARLSGLEEAAQHALKGGKTVPFSRLQTNPGRVVWAKPVSEVVTMGQLCGVDLAKPGAVTPKQALDKGVPAALIDAFSVQNSGSIVVVPDDGTDARRLFSPT